jgi:Uma2 family endonuclease
MSIAIESFLGIGDLPIPLRRFTVEEYHRLGQSGVLGPEDRVELLEGWIVEKMNHRPAHGFAVTVLNEWFVKRISYDLFCRCQLPVTLAKSEPEPDLAIVSGNLGDFRTRHPSGPECRLLIEVADTSVARDRAKGLIYAAAGVPETWIVNLVDEQIEQLTCPRPQGYQDARIFTANQTIELELTGVRLAFPVNVVLGS